MGLFQRALLVSTYVFSVASISGCGGGSALGETPTISGHVDSWTKGQSQLAGVFYGGSAGVAVGTSTIDASGNFSIALAGGSTVTPALQIQVPADPKLASGCTGTQQWDPGVYGTAMLILVTPTSGSSSYGGIVQLGGAKDAPIRVDYLYVDRDWNSSVEIDCKNSKGGADHTSIQLHYKAGWNRQITAYTPLANAAVYKIYTGDAPEGVGWVTQ